MTSNYDIKQYRSGWTATDTERGIELSSPTREALDEMIAKVEAPRIPTPRKQVGEMTDEELKEYHTTAPVSRQAADEMLRYWTGRGPQSVPPQQETIAARFQRFHENNPHVYAWLVREARRQHAVLTQLAIADLFEDLRRWSKVRTNTAENYKVSNDFRAYYARLIMSQEPDLAGVFEIRQLESA